jgi:hypothetical protein
MDDWDKRPRWALIYGGNSYIVYLVLPILVGSTRRCTLISSGVLYIDDTECPFAALMSYILLSADTPHEQLAMLLNIKIPPEIVLAESDHIGEPIANIIPNYGPVNRKPNYPEPQN